MNRYEELSGAVKSVKPGLIKFYEKGNNAIGTSVQKAMQNLKALSQKFRTDVQLKNPIII